MEAAMDDANATVRAKHSVVGPALTFDLEAEIAQLQGEGMWQEKGHNAKTLARQSALRIVLMVLREGATLQEHTTDHQVAIHPLRGAVRVRRGEQSTDVCAGMLLVLDSGVAHAVEALEDAAMLLYLGAP
jgi:quercetin dioxygenase-like cupin family protein